MPASQHNPPVGDDSQHLEQLVAWLDSELDEEQSQEVELLLRNDAGLRQKAEELERAWEMLDTLEPVSADHQFTVQTIQAVYEDPHGDTVRRTAKLGKRFLTVASVTCVALWFLVGFLGTLTGIQIARLTMPAPESTPDAQILGNLDLLSRYPEYSAVRNIRLLRQLQTPPETEYAEQDPVSDNDGMLSTDDATDIDERSEEPLP